MRIPEKRLIQILVFAEIVLFVLSISLTTLYHTQKLKNKSQLFLDATRNDFLLGDQRSLLQKVQVAESDHEFRSITFIKATEPISSSKGLLDREIILPILSKGSESGIVVGAVRFVYSLRPAFGEGLLFWTLSSIVLLASIPLLKSSLKRQLRNEMEFEKLRALNKLATQVAHDIRSPLSALQIVSGASDLNTTEARELIKATTLRIKMIAQDLVDEFKSGLETTALRKVLIDKTLEEIISEKRAEYSDRDNIQIKLTTTKATCVVNERDLKRVISNMINNSVEAMKKDSINIEIAMVQKDSFVEISIADDGSGIPLSTLEKIGKPDFKSEKKSSTSGAGLGLSHAFKVLDSFGGSISVRSELGKGSIFVLKIPCNLADENLNA